MTSNSLPTKGLPTEYVPRVKEMRDSDAGFVAANRVGDTLTFLPDQTRWVIVSISRESMSIRPLTIEK